MVVPGTPNVLCQPPNFNSGALKREDCLSCFCFGATDQCYSSDMYITQVGTSTVSLHTLVDGGNGPGSHVVGGSTIDTLKKRWDRFMDTEIRWG